MRYLLTIAVMSLVFLFPEHLWAAEYSNTVGGSIANTSKSLPFLEIFVTGLCLMGGVWLAANGLIYIKKSGENDGRHTATKGLIRIACGALLAAIPNTMGSGLATLLGVGHYSGGLNQSPGGVETCLAGASNASALECVAKNVGMNVVPVAETFIFALAMLFGTIVIFRGIVKLANHDGQGQQGKGAIIGQICVGLLACNVPYGMYIIQNTMGFTNGVMTASSSAVAGGGGSVPSVLSYTPDGSVAILAQFANTISWCFVFISLIGVIAFVKGLVQLYAATTGQGGHKAVNSGLVHMFGGVCAANIKLGSCLLFSTAIHNAFGLCS